MKENKIYKEYCKQNNINWKDAILHKFDIQNTFNYQCFVLKNEIDLICEKFLKDFESCIDYAKNLNKMNHKNKI